MKLQLKKFTTNNIFIYTLGIIFIFLIWIVITVSLGKGNLVFPSPIDTFKKTFELLSKSFIWNGIGWTLLRSIIGFGVSFVAAAILGTLAGNFDKLNMFLKPIMIVLKSIPTAAIVFLFLVLSGSKYAPIYIVVILSFPILYESFVGGVRSITPEINDAIKLDAKGFMYPLVKIKVPLALPYVIVGLASSFALSLKTEIMAEIITGSTDDGLGCAIRVYRNSDPTDLTPIFAIALIAFVIIVIFDIIGYFVKKKLDKNS